MSLDNPQYYQKRHANANGAFGASALFYGRVAHFEVPFSRLAQTTVVNDD